MTRELSTPGQSNALAWLNSVAETFDGVEKLSQKMAQCGTLPKHLVGKPADCFRVAVQALKWGMDPFAVAECTSLVHGRMCYEGKLVMAVLEQMRAIEGRLHWEITGAGPQASIKFWATPRGATKPEEIRGTVKDWRTAPGKNDQGNPVPNAWDKQPEVQLVYRAARTWARLHASGTMLGVDTREDREDETTIDVTHSATIHPAEARTGTATEPREVQAVLDNEGKKDAPPVSATSNGGGVGAAGATQQASAPIPAPTQASTGAGGQQSLLPTGEAGGGSTAQGDTGAAKQPEKPAADAVDPRADLLKSRELYKAIKATAGGAPAAEAILGRLAKLNGADQPQFVPAKNGPQFLKDLNRCMEMIGDLGVMKDWIGEQERHAGPV